jgi:hypothetical protein
MAGNQQNREESGTHRPAVTRASIQLTGGNPSHVLRRPRAHPRALSQIEEHTARSPIRTGLRWIVGLVVVLHGLIHLLGAAKGLHWAAVTRLTLPISNTMGDAWLAAAMLLILAGVMLVRETRGWWIVSGAAAAISQAVILPSWTDAKAGTVVNLVLLVIAGYGFAAQGPTSFRAEYQRRVAIALAGPPYLDTVTEADLTALPPAVAAYVRQSGALGESRVVNFRARIHGRIRADASKPWMRFTGEQVNTYGPATSRLFRMDATTFGLPVDVLHVLVNQSATMRVKLCSLLPIVNAAGPEMDRGETVTLFNDLCVLAPAALIDAPIRWRSIDAHRIHAEFTNGAHTVSAELVFNDDDELINFVSDDRSRTSADGRQFTPQQWSTPLGAYRTIGARRFATYGEGRWHGAYPEGEFSYVELNIDDIAYNSATASAQPHRVASA